MGSPGLKECPTTLSEENFNELFELMLQHHSQSQSTIPGLEHSCRSFKLYEESVLLGSDEFWGVISFAHGKRSLASGMGDKIEVELVKLKTKP